MTIGHQGGTRPWQAFRTLSDGIALTHFIVAEDVERGGRFYSDVLGGEIVLAGQPTIVALANSWIIIDVGGGTHRRQAKRPLLEPPRDRRADAGLPGRSASSVHRPSQPDQTEKEETRCCSQRHRSRTVDRFVEVFSSTAAGEAARKHGSNGSGPFWRPVRERPGLGGSSTGNAQGWAELRADPDVRPTCGRGGKENLCQAANLVWQLRRLRRLACHSRRLKALRVTHVFLAPAVAEREVGRPSDKTFVPVLRAPRFPERC